MEAKFQTSLPPPVLSSLKTWFPSKEGKLTSLDTRLIRVTGLLPPTQFRAPTATSCYFSYLRHGFQERGSGVAATISHRPTTYHHSRSSRHRATITRFR